MLIVGIAGGIASGKSAVSSVFEQWGAFILDADRTGHLVLEEPDVRNEIRKIWGDSVFQKDGSINRRALGEIVFSPERTDDLKELERITHPRIRSHLERKVSDLKKSGEYPIVILDAPVMFKAGWGQFCDQIVFIDSNFEDRCHRAMKRGWTEQELRRREAAQVALETKRMKADWVIQNTGSLDELRDQARNIWEQLVQVEPNRS